MLQTRERFSCTRVQSCMRICSSIRSEKVYQLFEAHRVAATFVRSSRGKLWRTGGATVHFLDAVQLRNRLLLCPLAIQFMGSQTSLCSPKAGIYLYNQGNVGTLCTFQYYDRCAGSWCANIPLIFLSRICRFTIPVQISSK